MTSLLMFMVVGEKFNVIEQKNSTPLCVVLWHHSTLRCKWIKGCSAAYGTPLAAIAIQVYLLRESWKRIKRRVCGGKNKRNNTHLTVRIQNKCITVLAVESWRNRYDLILSYYVSIMNTKRKYTSAYLKPHDKQIFLQCTPIIFFSLKLYLVT